MDAENYYYYDEFEMNPDETFDDIYALKPIETKYYEELGVKPDATLDDIERAYHQFILQADEYSHGTDQMKYISMIYEILSNAYQRTTYDLFGESKQADEYDSEKLYCTEYTEKFEPLEMLNGYHRVEHNLKVTLRDMVNGVVKRLQVKRYVKCSNCKEGDVSCQRCDGKRTYKMVPFVVVFDASDSPTKSYTLRGKHNNQSYIPTLLTVNVIEEEHPLFKRKGIDMIMKMSFGFREAVIGFDRIFTTVDDRIVRIKKRPGETTHNGEQMLVRYEGLTYFYEVNKKKKGNLIIECCVSWEDLDTLAEPVIKLLQKTSPLNEEVQPHSENEEIYQLESLSEEEKQVALHFDKGQQNDLEMMEYLQ